MALTGKIIGTPGCWDGDGSHEYTNVFDGDPIHLLIINMLMGLDWFGFKKFSCDNVK